MIDAAMDAHWFASERGLSDRTCMLLAIEAAITKDTTPDTQKGMDDE